MNEYTMFLMLLVPPLCEAPAGVGDFSWTITEPGHVQVLQGTIEYQKNPKGGYKCRLEINRDTIVGPQGAKTEDRKLQFVLHVDAQQSQYSMRNFPGEKDSDGDYNFGALLFDASKTLEAKTIDAAISRKYGFHVAAPQEKPVLITYENARGSKRVGCLTAQHATPVQKAWIKSGNVVSGALQWQDKEPDLLRLKIPVPE